MFPVGERGLGKNENHEATSGVVMVESVVESASAAGIRQLTEFPRSRLIEMSCSSEAAVCQLTALPRSRVWEIRYSSGAGICQLTVFPRSRLIEIRYSSEADGASQE